jgi:hypothetical protein
VSKERAARRAARQAEIQAAAAQRRRQQERITRRQRLLARWRPHDRRGRPDSVLAQRRRRQDAAVAFIMVSIVVVAWIMLEGWAARLTAILVSALAVPVLMTLLFDRRN